MNRSGSNSLFTGRLTALIAVLVLALPLFVSCHKDVPSGHANDPHYRQVDSVLRDINSIDDLNAKLRGYQAEDDSVGMMLAYRYLGERLRFESRFAEAVNMHHRGYYIASQRNDTLEMALELNHIGTVYRRTGQLDSAIYHHYSAMRLCDEFSDTVSPEAVKGHVRSLAGIGSVELSMRNYKSADSVFRLALAGEESLGNDRGIAMNYTYLGNIKKAQGDNDSAMYFYTKSLEYNKKTKDENGVAQCHENFGEVYESENRLDMAQSEYRTAYEMMLEKGDRWHWVGMCVALARVNIKMGNYTMADAYASDADTVAHSIGALEIESQVFDIKSQLAEHNGNHKDALRYYKQAKALEDSVYGWSRSDVLRDQSLGYERVKSLAERDSLNQNIAREKKYRNWLLLALIALAIITALGITALIIMLRTRARNQKVMNQIEETRNLFFTNVVHQLRTPLTAIMGAIDNIVDTHPHIGNGQYNAVDIIGRQGSNLLLLVDRILEVGDVHSAVVTPDWRRGDAVAFVRMVVEGYRDDCLEKHLELTYSPREKSTDIDVVPRYLGSIVGRLLENSIAYSHEYCRITVTTQVDKDHFVICVADNGMGIDENDLPHVIEPFYRGVVAEQMVEGVGIGLTVVHDMCLAMDGTVTVDSKPGLGTVVTVKLPCNHNQGVKKRLEEYTTPVRKIIAKAIPADKSADGKAERSMDRPVVLIVEDHNDVAHLIGAMLGTGYDIHYATNGERGIHLARELKPELIITDMKMPIMDGLEMCRRIRASRQLSVTPIIMLSAHSSVGERVKAIEAGADIYLAKPADSLELRTWVSHLVVRHKMFLEYFGTPGLKEEIEKVLPKDNDSMEDTFFLERFVRFVELQSASGNIKLDLDLFAREEKMGETQVKQRIQALTGMTTTAFITQARMARALRLLKLHPDMRVGDIAEQCGFNDMAYFSRVFRQYHGMSPTQARNAASSDSDDAPADEE